MSIKKIFPMSLSSITNSQDEDYQDLLGSINREWQEDALAVRATVQELSTPDSLEKMSDQVVQVIFQDVNRSFRNNVGMGIIAENADMETKKGFVLTFARKLKENYNFDDKQVAMFCALCVQGVVPDKRGAWPIAKIFSAMETIAAHSMNAAAGDMRRGRIRRVAPTSTFKKEPGYSVDFFYDAALKMPGAKFSIQYFESDSSDQNKQQVCSVNCEIIFSPNGVAMIRVDGDVDLSKTSGTLKGLFDKLLNKREDGYFCTLKPQSYLDLMKNGFVFYAGPKDDKFYEFANRFKNGSTSFDHFLIEHFPDAWVKANGDPGKCISQVKENGELNAYIAGVTEKVTLKFEIKGSLWWKSSQPKPNAGMRQAFGGDKIKAKENAVSYLKEILAAHQAISLLSEKTTEEKERKQKLLEGLMPAVRNLQKSYTVMTSSNNDDISAWGKVITDALPKAGQESLQAKKFLEAAMPEENYFSHPKDSLIALLNTKFEIFAAITDKFKPGIFSRNAEFEKARGIAAIKVVLTAEETLANGLVALKEAYKVLINQDSTLKEKLDAADVCQKFLPLLKYIEKISRTSVLGRETDLLAAARLVKDKDNNEDGKEAVEWLKDTLRKAESAWDTMAKTFDTYMKFNYVSDKAKAASQLTTNQINASLKTNQDLQGVADDSADKSQVAEFANMLSNATAAGLSVSEQVLAVGDQEKVSTGSSSLDTTKAAYASWNGLKGSQDSENVAEETRKSVVVDGDDHPKTTTLGV